MIVLDLEWNRGYDKTPLDEILQIGAVRLDRPGGPITDTFCVSIAPRVHKRLNRTAKQLPAIDRSLTSSLTFRQGYGQFLAWCGDDRDFAAWGGDEIDTLNQNAAFWQLPPLQPQALHDLQAAFSLTLGTMQSIALWWAVDYCQIPDLFDYHDALNDAMYTALIARWIPPRQLELAAQPRWALRYLARPFQPQPSRPAGIYRSRGAALNGKDSRLARCPICGAELWVCAWDFHDPSTYYADLRCPGHGHFICRLSLSRSADGQWRGLQEIPVPSPQVLEDYGLAREGEHFLCKERRKRRRRYRRRKKENS